MATILSLKRRIQAARNVSKTTRAMQMISASKMKRAQSAAFAARPYAQRLELLTKQITESLDQTTFSHPYLTPVNTEGRTLFMILGPDKGLCGSLITNLLREFFRYQQGHKPHTVCLPVGKKIEGKVARASEQVIASFPFGVNTPDIAMIYPFLQIINEQYLEGKVSSVKILYTHFNSFFSQKPVLTTLLPMQLPEQMQTAEGKEKKQHYLFEPSAKELLPALLKHTLETSLYHYLLESFLSEQASRMIAMQNATNNANDIISDLLLEYNKTRQAKIT